MDRQEVWDHVVHALRERFGCGEFHSQEFRVVQNDSMGTVTIIEVESAQAFTLLDVSGAHFTGGDGADPVSAHLQPNRPDWLYGA